MYEKYKQNSANQEAGLNGSTEVLDKDFLLFIIARKYLNSIVITFGLLISAFLQYF